MENENETVYDIDELLFTYLFTYYDDCPDYKSIALCKKTPEDIFFEGLLSEISNAYKNIENYIQNDDVESIQTISKFKLYIKIIKKIINKEEIYQFDTKRFINHLHNRLLERKYKYKFYYIFDYERDSEKIQKILYNIELKKKINEYLDYYHIEDELRAVHYVDYVENENEYLYYLVEKQRDPKLQKYFK